MTDGRTKHWGRGEGRGEGQGFGQQRQMRRANEPHWVGRGNVKLRNEREREERFGEKEYSPFRRGRDDRDRDDELGDYKAYRGSRYKY